jgi:uncharacterized protein (DUF433 family)
MPIIENRRPPAESARIMGTGIEVWQVVKTYLEAGCDWERLKSAYTWLPEADLREALSYANDHRDDITARIREDYQYLPEELRPSFPIRWD